MRLSSPNSIYNASSVDSNVLPPQFSSELPSLCILCNIESFCGVIVQEIGNFDGRIIVDVVIEVKEEGFVCVGIGFFCRRY